MKSTATFVCTIALANLAAAQGAANTTAAALTAVDTAYVAAGLALGGNSGFGINLTSTALITATYPRGRIVNGRNYAPSRLGTEPNITVTPSDAFNASASFVLTLSDASALADPDPAGNFRHWLVSDLAASEPGSDGSLVLTGGTVVTDYAAPGPLAGSGVHRYAFLLFVEPDGFTPPANLSAPGTAPSHWYVSDYVQQTGLTLVGATFFLSANTDDTAPASGGAGPSPSVAPSAIPTRASITFGDAPSASAA